MAVRFILTGYVDQLMNKAVYDKLEDGTFAGRIPGCKGVIAFAATLRECEDELHSTLEDWVLLGLQHRLTIPSNEEYSVPQLKMMISEVTSITGQDISADDWQELAS